MLPLPNQTEQTSQPNLLHPILLTRLLTKLTKIKFLADVSSYMSVRA